MPGGRANRLGVPALYLSLTLETGARKYQQSSSLMPPGTLVCYEVTSAPVVNFRGGYARDDWAPLWESVACDWRSMSFDQRIELPS